MPTELPTEGPFARLAKAKQQQEAAAAAAAAAAAGGAAAAVPSCGDGGAAPLPTAEQQHNGAAAANGGGGSEPAISVRDLEFSYPGLDGRPIPGQPPLISGMSLDLPPGSRCLLIGANGAGKTTLLKILGGKHMVARGAVNVLGRSPFHDTALTSGGDLSYVGGNWTRDIAFAGTAIPLTVRFFALLLRERAAADSRVKLA
jgi:CCR4-NOT complex subunit CAF16